MTSSFDGRSPLPDGRGSLRALARAAARATSRSALVWLVLLTALLPACGDASRESAPSTRPSETSADTPQRLVTLAPALSQMIVDLEAGDRLVGVSKNDPAAPADTEVVGTFIDVNTEKLVSLKPTHVLMLTSKEGAPPRVRELARDGQFELITYDYPRSVKAVAWLLHHEAGAGDSPSVGHVLNRAEAAKKLKRRLLGRLEKLDRMTLHWPKPRTLMVIGTDPLTATGPGTVNDELLDAAGGYNAARGAAVTAPTLGREQLLAMNPDAIVLLDPGGEPLASNPAYDKRLTVLRGLNIPAVRDQRIALLNDPRVFLPSTNLARTAIALAKALHPDKTQAIDEAMKLDDKSDASSTDSQSKPEMAANESEGTQVAH